jgi:hypothetical protein
MKEILYKCYSQVNVFVQVFHLFSTFIKVVWWEQHRKLSIQSCISMQINI